MFTNNVKKILGIFEINQSINVQRLVKQSVEYKPKNMLFWWIGMPIKPGIYSFYKNGETFYICRTRLGIFFPSLSRLAISPKLKLVPNLIRWIFGCFLVFFVGFGLIPIFYHIIHNFKYGLFAMGFWLFFIILLLSLTEIEKRIAINGFLKF